MKKSEVTVVETLRAAPSKVEELKKALRELVPLSRRESGCLQYDLLEPFEGLGDFLVLMRWESISDLRKHEASPHVAAFIRKYSGPVYTDVTMSEWKRVM